jgi:ribosomal protein S16
MRAFDIFGALLDNWAKHVDIGTYDPVMQPREYQMAIQAKRIIDALKVYNS